MPANTRSQVSFVRIVLVLVLGVAVVSWFAYNKVQYTQKVNEERALYAAADKEAKAYIDAIAAKYPGEVKSYKYCEYSSAKFSKGVLGCTVETTITVSVIEEVREELLAYANQNQKELDWSFAYDNTKPILRTGDDSLIKILVYKKDKTTCSVRYSYAAAKDGGIDKNKIEISAGCSGNALAEYYPVLDR